MTVLNDGYVAMTATAQHHLLHPLVAQCVHPARGVPTVRSAPENSFMKPQLSAREVEVLRTWLLLDSKREAGLRLFISEATVSTHLTRIKPNTPTQDAQLERRSPSSSAQYKTVTPPSTNTESCSGLLGRGDAQNSRGCP